MPLASFAVFNEVEEDAVKGEKPTKEGWRHPGDYVLQIEVRVSLYEPLEMLGRLECRLEWRPLGNKLEFMDKKTGRYHYFGVDEGRWWCPMSCLGVTGKPMVVTYLGRSGNPTDGLPCNMDNTWTTYYGKDFTRIVLELIGALEQRIRVVTISKVNALRFTLWKGNRKGKQVWWLILLARWKGAAKLMLNSFWGKFGESLLEVKKVDVTSWKCHRLPWNCG